MVNSIITSTVNSLSIPKEKQCVRLIKLSGAYNLQITNGVIQVKEWYKCFKNTECQLTVIVIMISILVVHQQEKILTAINNMQSDNRKSSHFL